MSGTVGNAVVHRVTFVDANENPTAPDARQDGEDVLFELTFNPARAPFLSVYQAVGDAVSTGVYELEFTPTDARAYWLKATAIVGGSDQAIPYTMHEVEP
jgi:hypothetical protein